MCTKVAVTCGAPTAAAHFLMTEPTNGRITMGSLAGHFGDMLGRLAELGKSLAIVVGGAASGSLVSALVDDAVVLFARFWFSRRVNQLGA